MHGVIYIAYTNMNCFCADFAEITMPAVGSEHVQICWLTQNYYKTWMCLYKLHFLFRLIGYLLCKFLLISMLSTSLFTCQMEL